MINDTAYVAMQLVTAPGKHTNAQDTCFRNVPDCSSFCCVPQEDVLNGLAFGHTLGMAWSGNWLHITMAGFGTALSYSFSVILKTGPKAKFVLKKTLFTLFV